MNAIFCGMDRSSDDDASEVEIRRKRRNLGDDFNPFELSDDRFVNLFRMSKEAFMEKFKLPVRSTGISVVTKLAATLQFLAHGGYQLSVAQDFYIGMRQTTVSAVMKESLTILEFLNIMKENVKPVVEL